MAERGVDAARRARTSRFGARLIAVAASLVAVLAALEVGARVHLGERFVFGAFVGPPQAICGEFDAELGWRNRAGTSVDIAQSGRVYHVTINSRGLRSPERPYEKPPGKKRVVVLGDSTAWGWGVDDERMWTRLVERELGGAVELINLAVPGYGTDQELWSLESEGLMYAPDLVLLAFVHNDAISNTNPVMQGLGKPFFRFDVESGAWAITNRPVPLPPEESELAQRLLRRKLSMYSAVVKLLEPPPPQPSRYALEDPNVQAGIARLWDRIVDPSNASCMLLGRVRETAANANADMLAFVLPHLVDRWLYDPTTPLPSEAGARPYATYGTQKLAEAGKIHGFATFSVDDALLDVVSRGVNLDCGDEHLNERGNEIVAEVVAARLREWLAGRGKQ